jgi:hypothetical protein
MKKKFKVYDWAGNEMAFGEFPTFDDAWADVMRRFPNEEDLQEFYVEEV